MKKKRGTYKIYQLAAAAFMILALLWLTVSTPFVYSHQQNMAAKDKIADHHPKADSNDEESTNPFGNSTEEKSSNSGTTLSEEYLHDHHINEHFFTIITHYPKCEDADTYIAFHGELLVPPPNLA